MKQTLNHLHADTLSIRELAEWAERARLLDAPIRICDGMAVSYYPQPICIAAGRYEVILDLSGIDPVEYDDLPENRQYLVEDNDEPTGVDELPL